MQVTHHVMQCAVAVRREYLQQLPQVENDLVHRPGSLRHRHPFTQLLDGLAYSDEVVVQIEGKQGLWKLLEEVLEDTADVVG